ncbi:MAG: IS1634 family transposase [Verrucomicrobia bacterium]|jgi:transposase|nr:IS1634 family transposase [Verrucomicrobiota bacterium]
MFFRVKKSKQYSYLQIVESYRDEGAVKQHVLMTVGRLDLLQQEGKLDALMRSGLRLCENIDVIDAHAKGNTKPVSVLRIGPDLVFARLWKETGLASILRSLLQERSFGFELERAVYLTVLHRLFCPGSDRAAEKWKESYRIDGVESLQLHQLYRTMGWLGEPLGDEKDFLGHPRSIKDQIEEALFDQRRDLFSQIDLVFFDTTSIYFEGEGGQSIGQHGYSKDHRPDLKQMVVGLALDAEGNPICCHLWPGNTSDATTLIPVVKDMQTRFGVQRVCIVSDRGMVSQKTTEALRSEEIDCDYILGVRMRRVKDVYENVLKSKKPYVEIQPERRCSKDPSPLKVKEVMSAGKRYIVCLNEEQRRKDAADRETILAALSEKLKQGAKSLVGNKGYRKYLKGDTSSQFTIDEAKVKSESKYDGIWVLETNTDMETEVVAQAYKQLWMVEDMFRSMKSILETRPIYHKCDDTIRGHVFCSFLALVLRQELERRLEAKGLQYEWKEIIRGLENLHEVEAEFQGQTYFLRSKLVGDARQACQAAGVAIPPTMTKR